MRPAFALTTLLLLGTFAAPAAAQAPDGAAVFQANCASCHAQPAPDSRAPTREVLAQLAPESILVSLTSGQMFRQGSALTDAERRAVAGFLAGRPVGTPAPPSNVGRCTTKAPVITTADLTSGWNGWGAGAIEQPFPAGRERRTDRAQIPQLKLKWAFGFPGVSSARSQPAIRRQPHVRR